MIWHMAYVSCCDSNMQKSNLEFSKIHWKTTWKILSYILVKIHIYLIKKKKIAMLFPVSPLTILSVLWLVKFNGHISEQWLLYVISEVSTLMSFYTAPHDSGGVLRYHIGCLCVSPSVSLSICLLYVHPSDCPYFPFWMITWVNVNGFSQNLCVHWYYGDLVWDC